MISNGLDYHHLLYFWAVAKEGSLRPSAACVTTEYQRAAQATRRISGDASVHAYDSSLVLTDTGQTVLEYAEEIFSLGRELLTAVR